MEKKTTLKSNSQHNNFFQFCFEKQVITLVKKIKTKKIINVFTFLNQIKNALVHKFPMTVYYATPYTIKILDLLKTDFYVFNYFKITSKMLPSFLFSLPIPKYFLNNLICVIFKPLNLFGNLRMLQGITFISTTSRIVFISYKQLLKLTSINNDSALFLLNTPHGIITHKIALKKKIGGSLLCKIY
jgi:ribosomal protein S8